MILRRSALTLLVTALLAAPVLAQPSDDSRSTPIPTEGFWPTPRMMDRIIDRITDEVGRQYEFDDEQIERTRALFKERFPAFLNQNRGEIQTLANQFFEAQLAGEPPTPETVAQWAQRVQPLLTKFTTLATETAGEMSTYMTDEQALRLEGELAAFETGVKLVNNKLGIWSAGGYDPQTEWIPDGRARRRREREMELKMRAEMDEARRAAVSEAVGETVPELEVEVVPANTAPRATGPTRPAAPPPPKDEWEKYVDAFVARYNLTPDQQQDAMRLLRAKQKERDEYLTRRTNDLVDLQKRIAAADDEDKKKALAAEMDKLNAPVERMFQQLKDRVDRIPSPSQRRRAAQEAADKSGSDKPADADRPATTSPAADPPKRP